LYSGPSIIDHALFFVQRTIAKKRTSPMPIGIGKADVEIPGGRALASQQAMPDRQSYRRKIVTSAHPKST